MHKSIIAFAFLATLASVAIATADDFSALLADLSFGDVPALNEHLTPTDPPEQPQLRQLPDELTMPGAVELQAPVSTELTIIDDQVDLEAAFAVQQPKSGIEAQPVGHCLLHDDCADCDQPESESEFTCTPHVTPSLPYSTFYQYFRSNKCNTNVWDGYRQHCRCSNSHINGTCDCYKVREKKVVPVYHGPVVECTDCNLFPSRQHRSPKKTCDNCTSCDG